VIVVMMREIQLPVGKMISLPSEWWQAAGMDGFKPISAAYGLPEGDVFLAPLSSIMPMTDTQMIGRSRLTFNGLDRDRMVSALSAIATGATLPPIKLFPHRHQGFEFLLADGMHRFYASMAVGFTHIPAIEGWVHERDRP